MKINRCVKTPYRSVSEGEPKFIYICPAVCEGSFAGMKNRYDVEEGREICFRWFQDCKWFEDPTNENAVFICKWMRAIEGKPLRQIRSNICLNKQAIIEAEARSNGSAGLHFLGGRWT